MTLPALALGFDVPGSGSVSALLTQPADPVAAYVFAHGAGAGMAHAFMADLADQFAQRGIASLRYQFPSMERGSRRPDVPAVAHAAVRAAVAEARRRLPGVPFSPAARRSVRHPTRRPCRTLTGCALVFVASRCPCRQTSIERATHLARVHCPMLFLQGTRDALADLALLRTALAPLGNRAQLTLFDDADHAFHVRARSGTTDAQVLAGLADTTLAWCNQLGAGYGRRQHHRKNVGTRRTTAAASNSVCEQFKPTTGGLPIRCGPRATPPEQGGGLCPGLHGATVSCCTSIR